MSVPRVCRHLTPRLRRHLTQSGTVTAEAAVVLPVVAAFALVLVWVVSVGVAQIQVVDAARDAARALARGDDRSVAVSVARRAAPAHADIDVAYGTSTVKVSVESEHSGPGWLMVALPTLTVRAQSTVEVEDNGSQ